MTPKSLAEIVGLKVSPRRDSDISTGNLRRSCLVPMSINFGVFSIVLATPFRYSRKIVLKRKYIALQLSTSCIINERRSLESSTYDSNRLVNDNCGISLIHIQNRYTIYEVGSRHLRISPVYRPSPAHMNSIRPDSPNLPIIINIIGNITNISTQYRLTVFIVHLVISHVVISSFFCPQ